MNKQEQNLAISKLILPLLISVFFIGSYATAEARTFVTHQLNANASEIVEVNPATLVVTIESGDGYTCTSATGGTCECIGPEDSEDCIAMANNICKVDENGDVDLTCSGATCSCEWGTGLSGGGFGGGPFQTQGID